MQKKGKALECYNFQKTMQRKRKLWNVTTSKKQCKEREGFGMLKLPKQNEEKGRRNF
jgi:hypothetical protein